MKQQDFCRWLASLLGQNEHSAKRLLSDRTALQFLIAWSLFEAKLAEGQFKAKKLLTYNFYPDFSTTERAQLAEAATFFHLRYQNRNNLEALAPLENCNKAVFTEVESCLAIERSHLAEHQMTFLCAFVASRVRNNMFHGVKGIDDWLRDEPLIQAATVVLTTFVSAAERMHPSISLEAA